MRNSGHRRDCEERNTGVGSAWSTNHRTSSAGEGKANQEREIKGIKIPYWKNCGGFSLSYTFVPAIGFSTYILLVLYCPSQHNLATSPSSPYSWSPPGLKVFARTSRFSPVWHRWKPSAIPGKIWTRLQNHISKANNNFPKPCLSCRITL